MTTPNIAALTRAQHETLKAAALGQVSTADPAGLYDYGTWRIGGYHGRAVTVAARALISKGVARRGLTLVEGCVPLIVTADGLKALSKAAHRG